MFSDAAHSLHWPPDVARYNMEALVFLSSGWLKTACVLLALFWYVRHAMMSMETIACMDASDSPPV
jgi:hypothetical protein